MLDFFEVVVSRPKKDAIEIFPDFIVGKSDDLMIKGGDFYAVWSDNRNQWCMDEDDAIKMIDSEIRKKVSEVKSTIGDGTSVKGLYLRSAKSGMIDRWHKFCQKQMRDNYHTLDNSLIFSNSKPTRKDYSSRSLPYPLEQGSIENWDKLVSVLYSEEERHKIEWAIGSVVSGGSLTMQKFFVFYGAAGTGKSTIMTIMEHLFNGYYTVFDAKALGSSSDAFALEPFKDNPLVAIQHDGDLSRIEDNTRLNSLVSHETMTVNEKFKRKYAERFVTTLFMGTNKPVKITDAKSGLLRRLIDITPTGNKIPFKEFNRLKEQIEFELGAIAYHCKQVYLDDPEYYDQYIPSLMLAETNDFYDFVLDVYHIFKRDDQVGVNESWEMYKTYCDSAKVLYPYPKRMFTNELRNYFKEYDGKERIFKKFRTDKFEQKEEGESYDIHTIELKEQASIFDIEYSGCFAQYGGEDGTPKKKWANVKTTLGSLDTHKVHYVKMPLEHIVIDFDIPAEDGSKDLEANLKAASKWPPTYAELSKSGKGIHLHYIYNGDVDKLSSVYDDHIEVKVFKGNASLRRKLTLCNTLPIATISSGLPLKGEKPVVNFDAIKSENGLRRMILKNLNKEYHANTTPSIQFIHKLLNDAYSNGIRYDVTDLRNRVLSFAAGSTNQASYCIKLVNEMPFQSDEPSEGGTYQDDSPLVFFDCEVFPNLFVVCWKIDGPDNSVVKMINPTSAEIAELSKHRLVGFNNRRYDNHICYARMIGYSNDQLFELSKAIVNLEKGQRGPFFGEAYNFSYTDIYDFSSAQNKKSLKKWEIELGIHHQELGLPWDQPVPEELWEKVAEYCCNDVIATEATFHHLKGDWTARQILADIAGMTPNDTTNSLTTRFVFGKEKNPVLNYVDLAETFPGYEYKNGKNIYMETDIGRGGYIISWPGIYANVALLDIASLHPNSIRAMNLFGEYTKNFTDIVDTRVLIKHKDFDGAKKMMNGRLEKYLDDPTTAKDLSNALKTAANSTYGLTAASFPNPFRDKRNVNNIVALRGALFMRTLQAEVEQRGFQIVAIKTDSIKIANATPEIIQFCMDFAQKYGYTFEHEDTYDRICQINDADYIARHEDGTWTSTGAFFSTPYIFKTLFSKEPITFADLCEVKEVKKGELYLDLNENLGDPTPLEKELEKLKKRDPENPRVEDLEKQLEAYHNYQYIGRIGNFCPIKPGCGGGLLMRIQDGKPYAATGTTGYRWLEAEQIRDAGMEDIIDKDYFRALVDKAIAVIDEYGDFEQFVSEEKLVGPWFKEDDPDQPPWNEDEGEEFKKR